MTLTAQDLVAREVHYCVSSLVSTLAQGTYEHGADDLGSLMDQALELASPIDDWEEAAIQAGFVMRDGKVTTAEEAGDDQHEWSDWRESCDSEGLDPYQREVYEHWIVSDWLADKLAAHGEKVDKDFAGMTIWARTTTGQAIYIDDVIEQILAELLAA